MNDTRDQKPSPVSHLDTGRAGFIGVLFAVVILLALSAVHEAGSASVVTTTTTPSATTSTTLPRNQVKVQVANASGISGIAAQVTNELQTQGWNTLPPENASSSATIPRTMVYYAAKQAWAAKQIGTTLKVSSADLLPISASTPAAGASGDDVVVILGANYHAG
jgi:hypothetical protein